MGREEEGLERARLVESSGAVSLFEVRGRHVHNEDFEGGHGGLLYIYKCSNGAMAAVFGVRQH